MVGILLISTGRYKQFIKQLLLQIDKFFLPKEELKIYLFADDLFEYRESEFDFEINQFAIEPLKFPEATMLRYRIFNEHSERFKECSHIFYSDVDMAIVATIGAEILGGGLTAVRHPGFFNGGGSWETRPESNCYVPPEKRNIYFAGGFQGGHTSEYLTAVKLMSEWIDEDLKNGITPVWHDESAWNKLLTMHQNFVELDSGYCLVQSEHLRKRWGIDHLTPRILALDKNHKELRG